MSSLKPRSKSVIFRITAEEYEYLKSETTAHGARSLSDLARSRVLGGKGDPMLLRMGRKLEDVESALQHLAAAIKSPERSNGEHVNASPLL